ncbi:6680_t:CDS:2 [Dentiscutata erythropus]|uniref:6680_t:CDS:1 n=1 Tax=Dentiscutata erythropus TaxID=1348616 RepID=A0A9N9AEQ3_9GLOM|nr:6680_t:CDS:2 [Dentiscutata erythropus]
MHNKRADSTCPQTLTPLSTDSKTIVGYFPGHLSDYTHYGKTYYDNNYDYVSPGSIPWNITHLNWIGTRNFNSYFNPIVLTGNININSNPSFANGTSSDRAGFITNVINFTTQVNIIKNLTTPTNKTGPSITLNQTSAIMSDWSKIVPSAKLNLGVDFYGVIELTAPVDLGSLDNNQTIPRNLTTAPFATSYSSDPSIYLFYDKCSFTLDKSIQLYPWYFMRLQTGQQTGPLINSCTAGNGWARKFDSETSTTYLYKVSSDSLVVGSPTPVYVYDYVSYEDPQSIQYKLKLITNNSYGGIAISDLYADSSDNEMLNTITSVFPVSYRNVTSSNNSSSSGLSIITSIIVALVILCCCGCCCYGLFSKSSSSSSGSSGSSGKWVPVGTLWAKV